MQTTLDIDLGVIIVALAPVITIVLVAWLQRKETIGQNIKLEEIQEQGNGALTWEKRVRLAELKTQKIVLERALGNDMTEEHLQLILNIEQQIELLETEIEQRNSIAALPPEEG